MSIRSTAAGSETAVLSEINITPLTDVLLVLLIIFMILASLAIPPGFERQLPCNCGAHSDSQRHTVLVVVTRRGRIFVDGRATSVSALYGRLALIHARKREDRISLYADAKAPYGAIVRVLDAAKVSGIGDVSFVTQ